MDFVWKIELWSTFRYLQNKKYTLSEDGDDSGRAKASGWVSDEEGWSKGVEVEGKGDVTRGIIMCFRCA